MIYRFRIVLDHEGKEDVFRDIEIRPTDTMEDLHNAIIQSFAFDGTEMASFYRSDDNWGQGEEIALFDMSETGNEVQLMAETLIETVTDKDNTKLIYVYDFLNMWTFLVELGEIVESAESTDYPNLLYIHGQIPKAAPERHFESDAANTSAEGAISDYDSDFYESGNYEDLDFDEQWN
jgi:hypothetical protein